VLKEKQYVGETNDPAAKLFAQFHAPQTNEMKKNIISEIKKRNSQIRVIFATSALGMGVDAPDIMHVIHITGQLSSATLCYNNLDISDNLKHIDKSMKEYCQSQETCLRQLLLNYLGFPCVKQERCCYVCEESNPSAVCNEPMESREKVRFLTTANTIVLQKLILKEVHLLEVGNSNSPSLMLIKSPIPCQNSLKKIMAEIEYIRVESDLLGIWDEECSSKFFLSYQHMPFALDT
jgi:superfamily II DNA helicase RecQ